MADNELPTMTVTKWADPATIDEGGATATFWVKIVNDDAPDSEDLDPLTLIHIFDTITDENGDPVQIDLLDLAEAEYGGPITLAPGEEFIFSFTREVTLDAEEVDYDTVTVTARTGDIVGDAIEGVSDEDGASVTGTNVDPSIEVTKTAPEETPEGGSDVTYGFTIENTSVATDPVTIAPGALVDDTFDDLQDAALYQAALEAWIALPGDDSRDGATVIVLEPGEKISFDFTANVEVDAGDAHVNEVSVTGLDDEGTEASDTDDHSVTGTDVIPVVAIDKAGETQIAEGGDIATYEVTIYNQSNATDPLTIISLVDDKFGNLLDDAKAWHGMDPDDVIVIQPGTSFTFSFDHPLVLDAGELHANVVTVVAADDEGNEVNSYDCHVVEGQDLAPVIAVDKTSDGWIAEGGEDQEFTITITNDSSQTDPVTVTGIMDSVFGDLLEDALAAWGGDGPIVIEPNGVFTFSFTRPTDIGNAADLDKHVNAVKVTVVDDEGTEGSAIACHVAQAEDVAPTITVEKTSDGIVKDGGDDQTYTFTITNTSGATDPVTLTSFDDDTFDETQDGEAFAAALAVWIEKDPDNRAGATEIVLQPGETLTFDVTVWVDIADDETHTNTVTVTATDDEGVFEAEAQASETVGVPKLAIEKQILVGDEWWDAEDPEIPQLLQDEDGKVEYRLVVTNAGTADLTDVTISDPALEIDGALVAETLAVGDDPVYVTGLYADWAPGEQVNTASAESTETGLVGQDLAEDSATYEGVEASISIVKSTVVNGDGEFAGDGVTVKAGDTVSWLYEVSNDGDVELEGVEVTDSDENVTVAADEVTNEYGTFNSGDTDMDGKLDTDETWIYTGTGSVEAEEGDPFAMYHNTGTATASHTDIAGTTAEVEASDDSSFYVIQGGFLTDGSLCDLGEEFDLNFKPDYQHNDHAKAKKGGEHDGETPTQYRLDNSDPATFVYNLFFDAGDLAEPGTVTLNIPYPFVLACDDPITAYSDVTVDDDCGAFCFQPGEEICDDLCWTTGEDFPAANGETYSVEISNLPSDGFVYLAVELKYDLVGTRPWERYEGEDDLVHAEGEPEDILDNTEHAFSAEGIAGSEDSLWNDNHFEGPSWHYGCDDGEKMKGHGKDDRMFGYAGRDLIKAKGGNDFVVGGEGNDKVWGGRGQDTFVFQDNGGTDKVMDFDAKSAVHDFIDLSEVSAIKGWKDLMNNHIEETKKGVWIHGDSTDIFLKGVDLEHLDKADFLFG